MRREEFKPGWQNHNCVRKKEVIKMIKEVLLAADVAPLPTLFMNKKNGLKCENGKTYANFTF